MDANLTDDQARELAAPFTAFEWKVVASKGDKQNPEGQLWAAYIDRIAVQRRLDDVVGPANWSFDIEAVNAESVIGRLTVCGITKADIGSGKGQDDPLKGAASDALKRAAVHFGIARDLAGLRVWKKGRERPGAKDITAPPPDIDTAPPRPKPMPKPAPPKNGVRPPTPLPHPSSDVGDGSPADKVRQYQRDNKLSLEDVMILLDVDGWPFGNPNDLWAAYFGKVSKQIDAKSPDDTYAAILDRLTRAHRARKETTGGTPGRTQPDPNQPHGQGAGRGGPR